MKFSPKYFVLALLVFLISASFSFADDNAAANIEDKLLPLINMEQAFGKALQRRNLLARYVEQETQKLRESEGDETAEIAKNLAQARKALSELSTYMDVIFGLGGVRNYEYDSVKSTIYLRVGTITEVFARAVNARDNAAKRIEELKKIIDNEMDETRKATLQKEHDSVAAQWALIVNALFNIYQVHPKRNYEFNPGNLTLYLKTNDEEIQKLQESIEQSKAE